ncbi:MAG: YlmH/Sll1252 family protein [Eubacteriales bacterium]|nr:YlmH/Sll1252 family protein [Eubacteriales bacterium]
MGDRSEALFIKRAKELAQRAENTGLSFHTEFMTVNEQSALRALRFPVTCAFYGGYESAERVIAVFGEDAEPSGYIACVEIMPKQQKFADTLTHRDFLGALMNLGVRRETMGDILVVENTGYLFCLTGIAAFILQNLDRVKRTAVVCSLSQPPQRMAAQPEPVSIVVASLRADALLSAAFRLSRDQSKTAVSEGRLFINGKQSFQASLALKEGDVLSLRGVGRVEYVGAERETKHGKLRVLARIYG